MATMATNPSRAGGGPGRGAVHSAVPRHPRADVPGVPAPTGRVQRVDRHRPPPWPLRPVGAAPTRVLEHRGVLMLSHLSGVRSAGMGLGGFSSVDLWPWTGVRRAPGPGDVRPPPVRRLGSTLTRRIRNSIVTNGEPDQATCRRRRRSRRVREAPGPPAGRRLGGPGARGRPTDRQRSRRRPRAGLGGPGRIRTFVGLTGRFTVCSLWPLGHRPAGREIADTDRRCGGTVSCHAHLRRRFRSRHARGAQRRRPGQPRGRHPLRLQGHRLGHRARRQRARPPVLHRGPAPGPPPGPDEKLVKREVSLKAFDVRQGRGGAEGHGPPDASPSRPASPPTTPRRLNKFIKDLGLKGVSPRPRGISSGSPARSATTSKRSSPGEGRGLRHPAAVQQLPGLTTG